MHCDASVISDVILWRVKLLIALLDTRLFGVNVFFKPLKDQCTTDKETVEKVGNRLNIPPFWTKNFDEYQIWWFPEGFGIKTKETILCLKISF